MKLLIFELIKKFIKVFASSKHSLHCILIVFPVESVIIPPEQNLHN